MPWPSSRWQRLPGQPSKVRGFIPTGWFPGGVCTDGKQIYIANVKGEGSHTATEKRKAWNSRNVRGSISRVEMPDDATLARYTAQVVADARIPQTLRALEAARGSGPAVPVPSQPGERSVIEHVVYVLKENRTYDQLFGDLPRGNNDPKLCTFGRAITPNHHALAEEFVLLDNYYCNGVISTDGHQWAMQGAISDYKEKMFGGHTRSYDFGTDVLTFANCNFLWDSVLLAGRSFRNYGECEFPSVVPKGELVRYLRRFYRKERQDHLPPFDSDGDLEEIHLPDVSRLEPGHPRRIAAGSLLDGVPPIREVRSLAKLRDRLPAAGPHRRDRARRSDSPCLCGRQ